MRFMVCSRVVPRPWTAITQVSRAPGTNHAGRGRVRRELEVGVVQAEGAARVADVQVRGEPGAVAGFRGAVRDAFEAAHDGVGESGTPGSTGPTDRVEVVTGEAVASGPQCGEVPGEGHLAGGRWSGR
ncbi:hypothetical protein GCM10023238_01880 [Streptomyces heliomycini]